MTTKHIRPERAKNAQPCPLHAELLAEVERLRAIAKTLFTRIRKFPQVRPDSPEAVYLRFLAIALDDADFEYGKAKKYGGTLQIEFYDVPITRVNAYRIQHRPPPAKIVSLSEYRTARAAAG